MLYLIAREVVKFRCGIEIAKTIQLQSFLIFSLLCFLSSTFKREFFNAMALPPHLIVTSANAEEESTSPPSQLSPSTVAEQQEDSTIGSSSLLLRQNNVSRSKKIMLCKSRKNM